MFNIFRDREPVALTIEPSLRFISAGNHTKCVVDTGENDLNQRISQVVLNDDTSCGVNSIYIEGFDKIYTSLTHVDDKSIVDQTSKDLFSNKEEEKVVQHDDVLTQDFAKLERSTLKSFLTNSYQDFNEIKEKRIYDEIVEAFKFNEGLVMGSVYLSLANGDKLLLAKPIYLIVPFEVNGKQNFVSLNAVHQYIDDEWQDEFAYAMNNLSTESIANGHIAFDGKNNPSVKHKLANSTKITVVSATLLCIFAGATGAVLSSKVSSNVSSTSSNSNMQTSNSIYSKPINTSYDPNIQKAQYNANGVPTAEEYAALQSKATENLLKRMNIDVTQSPADLGCLTQ